MFDNVRIPMQFMQPPERGAIRFCRLVVDVGSYSDPHPVRDEMLQHGYMFEEEFVSSQIQQADRRMPV